MTAEPSKASAVGEGLAMEAGVPVEQGCMGTDCGCLENHELDWRIRVIQQHLHVLLRKADELHTRLIQCASQTPIEGEDLAASLLRLIRSSQPFFNNLESSARSTESQYLPMNVCFQLLDFSQQLCGKFEKLLLTCASYNLLSVDESDPHSTSYFCIGSSQLGHQKITAYRYCKLVPYLAQVNTGLYKRMRWNVEDLREKPQRSQLGEGAAEKSIFTEYYFLCFEELSVEQTSGVDGNSHAACHESSVGLWSIGQWVQLDPNPNQDDLYDWILCEVPLASYNRLLTLGSDEPSCSSATDHLHQLLLSLQSKEKEGGTECGSR